MVWIRKDTITEIDKLAKEKITVFKGDHRPDGSSITKNFMTIRSLSAHIATDYGDRYLLELVQNAYDALADNASTGSVKILYIPQEGEWGTLYIANGGKPFTWNNVESICLIGQSDKPTGENIGNKGLGFRSVIYVSDEPSIFSLAGKGKNKDEYGYCFRFACDTDFIRWTDDAVTLEQLPEQLPPFNIPFPLETVPAQVTKFMDDGFVSVIALPVRNSRAQESIYKQIELLRSGPAPLLLFLKRLKRLEVAVDEQPEASFVLSRESRNLNLQSLNNNSMRLTLVTLNHEQQYMVAWDRIPEKRVKDKIQKSIEQQQLHPSWKSWEGDGELAVAVQISEDVPDSLLYTFLPMGADAKCPFRGFLHGAFYPKSDRTSLQADVPLNAMYIEESLRLTVDTVLAVKCFC